MSKRTLTDDQRRDIVHYRIENAQKMLFEVESHRENGFYNTAINRMYYVLLCSYGYACLIRSRSKVARWSSAQSR